MVCDSVGEYGSQHCGCHGDGNVTSGSSVVAGEMVVAPAAPAINSAGMTMLSPSEVKQWLEEARGLGLDDVTS